MIERVDYERQQRGDLDGVVITFSYENELVDAYEIFGEPDLTIAMNLLAMSETPECLLVNVRNMLRLTLH